MRNARAEGRTEGLAEFSWLTSSGLSMEEARRRWTQTERMYANPHEFHAQLGRELGISSPTTPAAATSAASEWVDPTDPEPDMLDMQGRPGGYSPKALRTIVDNAMARLRHQWEQQFGPVQQFVTTAQEQAIQQQETQRAQQTAQAVLSELRQDPEFKQHETEVLKLYAQMANGGYLQRWGAVATLQAAWNKYYRETVVPTLHTQARTQVLDDMRQSAAGGAQGVVTPPTPAPVKPKIREGNVDDLAAHMAAMAGQQ